MIPLNWHHSPRQLNDTLRTSSRRPLNLGQPYTVRGYPTGINSVISLPWPPATDGPRTLTGRVNQNGTATIWAVTSTVSGSGDQGADPNKLVEITDQLSATSAGSSEAFRTVQTAEFGEVLRGVSFTPGGCPGDGVREVGGALFGLCDACAALTAATAAVNVVDCPSCPMPLRLCAWQRYPALPDSGISPQNA
jgi:hypothetical protein